jgi:hypothetical protein
VIAALLRSRLLILGRSLFRSPPRGGWVRHPLVAVGVSLWLGSLVLGGLRGLFGALAESGALALALSATLVALLVFDVDDAVRTLVVDSDLELLRRAPLSPAGLLGLKLLDAAPRTALPLLVVAGPAVLAYAERAAPGPAFWPAATLVLAALWAIPLTLGLGLSLLILARVPAARAREALGLLATLTLTLLWIVSAVLLPRAVGSDANGLAALRAAVAGALRGPAPPAIAGRALLAATEAAWGPMSAELGWLALMVAGAVALMVAIGARTLPAVIERVAAGGGGRARARIARGGAAARPRSAWRTGSVIAAIVRRDGRMLGRNWTLLGDLAVASVLWALIPLAAAARFELPWAALSRMMLLALAVGLGYEIAARSIPFERHAAHWARLAPAPESLWLAGKAAGSALLALPVVIVVALVLASARPLAARDLWSASCLAAAGLFLSLATGLWAGATFGDPEWINPRAMLGLSGRILTSLLLLLQLALWLGVATLLDVRSGPGSVWIWTLAPALGAALSLFPLAAARRALG